MKYTTASLIILALVSGLAFAKTSLPQSESYAKIKLIAPLKISKTKDAKGLFEGLSPEAVKLGLGDAIINGHTQYSSIGKGKNRVTITWHSMTKQQGAVTASEKIEPALISRVVAKGDTIDPNTALTVKGDLRKVLDAYKQLAKSIDEKSKRTNVAAAQATAEKKGRSDAARSGDLSPVSSGGSTGGAAATPPAGGSSTEPNVEVTVTEFIDCEPRIDEAGGFVYAQRKKIVRTEGGEILEETACQDDGLGVPITAVYGGECNPLIDLENRKVYEQFTKVAVLSNRTITVAGCQADFDKFAAIASDMDACRIRHDFVNGKSIQQERLYYLVNAERFDITQCQDSNVTYAHYLTENTCAPVVDEVNQIAFIQRRVAYNLNNGQVEYASDCKPITTEGTPIIEAVCADKYEHDYAAGQTYLRTYTYYVRPEGDHVKVADCSRSTTVSFTHKHDTAGCGTHNDDVNLKSFWQANTYIETPDEGVIELAPCADPFGNTIPYAYIAREYEPAGTARHCYKDSTGTSWAGWNWGMDYPRLDVNCTSGSIVTLPAVSCLSYTGTVIVSDSHVAYQTGYQYTYNAVDKWLRGDGTTYTRPVQTYEGVCGARP